MISQWEGVINLNAESMLESNKVYNIKKNTVFINLFLTLN
jgi:hypothetical protein